MLILLLTYVGNDVDEWINRDIVAGISVWGKRGRKSLKLG